MKIFLLLATFFIKTEAFGFGGIYNVGKAILGKVRNVKWTESECSYKCLRKLDDIISEEFRNHVASHLSMTLELPPNCRLDSYYLPVQDMIHDIEKMRDNLEYQSKSIITGGQFHKFLYLPKLVNANVECQVTISVNEIIYGLNFVGDLKNVEMKFISLGHNGMESSLVTHKRQIDKKKKGEL